MNASSLPPPPPPFRADATIGSNVLMGVCLGFFDFDTFKKLHQGLMDGGGEILRHGLTTNTDYSVEYAAKSLIQHYLCQDLTWSEYYDLSSLLLADEPDVFEKFMSYPLSLRPPPLPIVTEFDDDDLPF